VDLDTINEDHQSDFKVDEKGNLCLDEKSYDATELIPWTPISTYWPNQPSHNFLDVFITVKRPGPRYIVLSLIRHAQVRP
jgi:hypothetical protein